jgi:hypothetical protein
MSHSLRSVSALLLFAAGAPSAGFPAPTLRNNPSADRLGIYFWGEFPSASADSLSIASTDIVSLGIHAVRTAISPSWDPQPGRFGDQDLQPLDRKIYRPDYLAFLTGKNHSVVMITAYEPESVDRLHPGNMKYRNRELFTEDAWHAYLAEVREAHRRFAIELMVLSSQTKVPYIVSNWEAAHDFPRPFDWTSGAAIEYYQARLDGLCAGRLESQSAGIAGTLFTAFEFVFLHEGGPDSSHLDRVPAGQVSDFRAGVAGLRGVDYWSYSYWSSMYEIPDSATSVDYNGRSVRQAFATMRAGCPGCEFLLGEVGYLHSQPEFTAAFRCILQESLDAGARYIFVWVLYDQPAQDLPAFGAFTLDRRITPLGSLLRAMTARPEPSRIPGS